MITAFGNVEAAVGALKAGAFDFVSKPVDLAVLRGLVQHALKLARAMPRRPTPRRREGNRLLGQSAAMAELRATIGQGRAQPGAGVHPGESGTGKELVARTIHASGARANGPFVPVNCGAIPAELMESEFFGHKKGSFTGAHADKEGLFQAADGGTLFLDEVAELPLHMQVKLLRAIQEKAVRPVGANAARVPVDVRILSATHKDLGRAGRKGASATTCTTASTSSSCACRRCASAARTCRCWPRAAGHHLPGAALQAEETGHRLSVAPPDCAHRAEPDLTK
jgi:two-component system response regulator PilR (NtrC family)